MYVNVVVGVNGLSGDPNAVALAKALAPGHKADRSRGSSSAFDATERDLSRELLERQRSSFAQDAEVVSIPATSVGGSLHDVARVPARI